MDAVGAQVDRVAGVDEVVEANAAVDREDVDVDPEVEGFVEVLDLLGNARLQEVEADIVGI